MFRGQVAIEETRRFGQGERAFGRGEREFGRSGVKVGAGASAKARLDGLRDALRTVRAHSV